MAEVRERLSEHGLKVNLTDAARKWLASEGYNVEFGARPLKRALQRYVESPLSVKLLSGAFVENDTVVVDAKDGEITFEALKQDDASVEDKDS